MKKLGKLSLKVMKHEMCVIDNDEKKKFVGGSGYPLSDFEIGCFLNYAFGNGDMELSQGRFIELVDYADSVEYNSSEWVEIGGNMYEARTVSFYGNHVYDYALGTATLFYDSCGNAVGFKDRYNFDAKPQGERDSYSEQWTLLGSGFTGEDYNIYYGICN